MKFYSIIADGVEYDITGTIDLKNSRFLIMFDLNHSNYDSILNVFFDGLPLIFPRRNASNPNSIVLKCKEDYFFVSKPSVSYFCPKSFSGVSTLEDLRIKTYSYIAKGTKEDIYDSTFNEYIVTSKLSKSFEELLIVSPSEEIQNKKYSFSYNGCSISLRYFATKDYYDRFLEFIITVSESKSFEYLEDTYLNILELITIVSGHSPTLQSRHLKNDSCCIDLFLDPVDKHISIKSSIDFNPIASLINPEILNDEILTKFITQKKHFELIYDILLYNLNTEIYQDIKVNTYVQLIEGFEKSVLKTDKRSTYKCLEIAFSNQYSKMLLVDRDKKIINDEKQQNFLSKAKNHRTYLSHLFNKQRPRMFDSRECIYANLKLSTCIRINILLKLGITPNLKMINNIVDYSEWVHKNYSDIKF